MFENEVVQTDGDMCGWMDDISLAVYGRKQPSIKGYFLGLPLTFSSMQIFLCVSLRPCSDSSATPSFPSQPEGKIGLPRANPRGRLTQGI